MVIIRPLGFEKEHNDCTVRALSLASNIQYSEVHTALAKNGRKNRHGIDITSILQDICKDLHITAKQVKRHGTLKSFLSKFKTGNYFCTERGHAFAVIDGISHEEERLNRHIKGAWLITK